MFINIDHEKRPSDYKLHLAKPNKEIISVLHERQNSTLNLKLGNISELNFSIPYFVEDSNLQMVKNPNIERIRELMYVKLTWGEFEEWFLIDNITESSEDNEIMNVQSFSIGYENKRKQINEFKETAINATEFYTEILKDSPWSIGEIDGSFDLLYRSFDESGTDRFELIKTGAETFGGVIVWDTDNKKINLKEPDNIGEFRGLTVSYDRLMSSLNKTRTTDEMVTRLYVYGNERITIENKNPTNEKYIEDYSYFIHPFKRDVNKNVLESSYYMSDSLCHALLDNKELRDEYEPQIKTIQKNIENKNASLSLAMIELTDAEFTLMSAKGLLDIAKAVNDKDLIEQRKTEVSNATSIVDAKKTSVNNLTSQIEVLQNQVSVLQNAISVRSFTKELIDELEPYIIEKEIEDARYINEDELYEFAKEKFSEIREPRVVIETGIEGLMNSVEEQYYWDKLVLGDTMRVRQKRMDIDYKSRIIEMNVELDDSDVEVKIANFTENVDNLDKFISILYSSESNSNILSNNKYKWDSVVEVRDQVTQLRNSEIDATKKRITAGVNESVEIGDRGIVITTPSFPNEMIIMQAGVIALSEDGGENWKTSITPNGVVAETIIGKLIAGNNLIITNDSGSIVMDGDGLNIESDSIKIMSGGENPKNLIDDWNNMIINMEDFANDGTVTPYEKSQISHQWNMISDSHSKIIESFIRNMGVETPENPYPREYDDYLIAYENLKEYLFTTNQSDGYTLLNPDRMDITSPIDNGTYKLLVRSFTSTKDNFILVMPMEYANAYMEVLESSISLNYVKNDEVVAKINLSEEGTRIDGKLLEINSRTEFNDDLVMNAGLIQDANGDITIDLNKGEINLSKPLTINYIPIATKEDLEGLEFDESNLSNIGIKDKTEILSGTEIFTDKADDSVVHVEIEGKSYQDGVPTPENPVEIYNLFDGYGENLFSADNVIESKMESTTSEGLEVFTNSDVDGIFYPIQGELNKRYTLTFEYKHIQGTSPIYLNFYYSDGTDDGAIHGALNSTDLTTKSITSAVNKTVIGVGYEGFNESIEWKSGTTYEVVPFTTVRQDDNTLLIGTEVVETEGVNGSVEVITEFEYINDVATGNKREVSRVTQTAMVPKVILVGTKQLDVTEWRPVTTYEVISFTTTRQNDDTLLIGTEVVKTQGVNGCIEVVTEHEYINNVATGNKREVSRVTEITMIPEVILVGTKKEEVPTSDVTFNFEVDTTSGEIVFRSEDNTIDFVRNPANIYLESMEVALQANTTYILETDFPGDIWVTNNLYSPTQSKVINGISNPITTGVIGNFGIVARPAKDLDGTVNQYNSTLIENRTYTFIIKKPE